MRECRGLSGGGEVILPGRPLLPSPAAEPSGIGVARTKGRTWYRDTRWWRRWMVLPPMPGQAGGRTEVTGLLQRCPPPPPPPPPALSSTCCAALHALSPGLGLHFPLERTFFHRSAHRMRSRDEYISRHPPARPLSLFPFIDTLLLSPNTFDLRLTPSTLPSSLLHTITYFISPLVPILLVFLVPSRLSPSTRCRRTTSSPCVLRLRDLISLPPCHHAAEVLSPACAWWLVSTLGSSRPSCLEYESSNEAILFCAACSVRASC